MSRNIADTAKRHFVRNGSSVDEVALFTYGATIVLVGGKPGIVSAEPLIIAERRVSSSGMANRLHARFPEVLRLYPYLSPIAALDHAIELVRAQWRVAMRRHGRRFV